MKSVLAIQASPRKKNTNKLLKSAAAGLPSGICEVEIVQLSDFDIKPCIGCHSCIEGRSCPLKDSVETLKQRMVSADALIIASPVYMGGVPGSLKNFIDRTADWFHRPELAGRPILFIVTTAGSYASKTGRYLNSIGMHWGCAVSGYISKTARQTASGRIGKSSVLNSFIRLLIGGSRLYSPGWKNLYLFTLQKVLARNILDVDKNYWFEKGWLDAPFFFPAAILPLKRIIMHLLFNLLARVIKPGQKQ